MGLKTRDEMRSGEIAVKPRLTCCNIKESKIPSGKKVSFENIISEMLSDYTKTFACV